MTMNKTKRMNTLANNGIDTSKYFNVMISKDVPKGTTFTVTIGEDGEPKVNMEMIQKIMNDIENEGYVKNSQLFRRWVMAQMFRMMKHRDGFNGALKDKDYSYQWSMLENELHAMSKLEKEDIELFKERKVFFTKDVIIAMLKDYKEKAKEEYNKYVNRWNKEWRLYILNNAVGIVDITIDAIKNANTYDAYYNIVKLFNHECKTGKPDIRLDNSNLKCEEWIDAYKGAGAYYTLQNMYRFHFKANRVIIPVDKMHCIVVDRASAEEILKSKAKEFEGEWWKLFGYMKEVIKLNNFSFDKAMDEKYGR